MPSCGDFDGVQTFKYRQSSLVSGPGPAPGALIPCTHEGPNLTACRTPSHFAAGSGARQRRSPTGGGANGMPRETVKLPSTAPCTSPPSTFTAAGISSAQSAAAIIASSRILFIATASLWLRREFVNADAVARQSQCIWNRIDRRTGEGRVLDVVAAGGQPPQRTFVRERSARDAQLERLIAVRWI